MKRILQEGIDACPTWKDSLFLEEGIKIYNIGVGSEKGGPIPLKRNGVVMSYKKNKNNETRHQV